MRIILARANAILMCVIVAVSPASLAQQIEKAEPRAAEQQNSDQPETVDDKTPNDSGEADQADTDDADQNLVVEMEFAGGQVGEEFDLKSQRTQIAERKLRYYLAFIDRCCELTDQQIADYKAIDKKQLSAVVNGRPKNKKRKKKKRGGLTAAFFLNAQVAAGQNSTIDYEKIDTAVSDMLVEKLTDSQRKKFEYELAAKKKFLSEVSVDTMVSFLDRELFLSEEQADLIRTKLAAMRLKINMQEIFLLNNGYIPNAVANANIGRHLDQKQQSIFRRFQRITWDVNEAGRFDQLDIHIRLGDK